MHRSSRELSSRVDIHVHRQPNWQRRTAWWLALYAGVGSLLWLSMEYLRGQNRHYQSGELATTHRMFENECWRCHNTWTPLQRLLTFNDDLHSTTNDKCETCHLVAEHQPHQRPAHRDIACAECHQEHKGTETLARPSDRYCLKCHRDLQAHGGQGAFVSNITGFDLRGGHPEFLLTKLVNGEIDAPPVSTAKGAKEPEMPAVEKFQRPGFDENARWQDRGRIRFNHARHLHARYDGDGKLVEGLIGENRELVDLSNKCDACHQPDVDHRFFKPIQFELHCCKCHPLLFDPERFPRQSVPHELPGIVRGFLTETYTLRTLSGATAPAPVEPQRFCASLPQPPPETSGDPTESDVDQPRRPFPGHRDQQQLSKKQADDLLVDVAQAEAIALDHRHSLFGHEAAGGCRYCHDVESVEPLPKSSLGDWKIVPTKIPARWLPHGEFHHEPHRLLNCGVCHVGVAVSENTGDVLIPSRAVCVACHSSQPTEWASTWQRWFLDRERWVEKREKELTEQRMKWVTRLKGTSPLAATTKPAPSERANQPQSFQDLLLNADRGTRTDCIECHSYHNPDRDKWNGPFLPSSTDLTTLLRGEASEPPAKVQKESK